MVPDFSFEPRKCPLCPDMLQAPSAADGGKPLVFLREHGVWAHWECVERYQSHRVIVERVLDEARQAVMELEGTRNE